MSAHLLVQDISTPARWRRLLESSTRHLGIACEGDVACTVSPRPCHSPRLVQPPLPLHPTCSRRLRSGRNAPIDVPGRHLDVDGPARIVFRVAGARREVRALVAHLSEPGCTAHDDNSRTQRWFYCEIWVSVFLRHRWTVLTHRYQGLHIIAGRPCHHDSCTGKRPRRHCCASLVYKRLWVSFVRRTTHKTYSECRRHIPAANARQEAISTPAAERMPRTR